MYRSRDGTELSSMLGILLLLTVTVGCSAQEMFASPDGCARANCTAYVQWSLVDSDTIQFELEGEAEGWVAVGVSADRVMGGDGIDDVFVCQRASGDDTVTAEDAYNPQVQSPRGNRRDTNQNGFQQMSTSYSSGRISCTFTRSILADDLAEDRNLNEYAYLLLAVGSVRGNSLTYHSGRWQAATPVLLGNPQGMFSNPTTCARASCDIYVQWARMGTDRIGFELEGTSSGWVAVGVSADQVMGGDGIDDVFVCQRASGDDTVTAEDAYNPQAQPPRANNRDSNQNGFQQMSTSYSSGRISCTFTRSILADNSAEDRNLNESVYLLLASGSQRGDALTIHTLRQSSANQMVLFTSAPPPTQPPTTPPVGVFTSSAASVQWMVVDSNTLQFVLVGAADGWVAVGVSADRRMGVDGIDDVFVCQRDATGDTVYAQDTYNPQDQSPRANRLDTNQNGFEVTMSSYDNGKISCTFTRSILADNLAEDRNLNESVYLLLAVGSARGGPDVSIAQHSARQPASAPVILTEGQSVSAACIDPMIRAHGILMYITWIWLVPTAYFFAAFMRTAMPGGAWFQIHRALMLIAIVPSVAGFILIFVAYRGSNNPNGLIVLGAENPIGTAHMAFGLVVILFQFINPIIPFCRCKPDHKYRWVFNWIHGKIIGRLLMIFAFVAVGLGTWRYSELVYGEALSVLYVFWIYISFDIVYTVWDTFMYIYDRYLAPDNKNDQKKKKKEDSFEMKPMQADSDMKEDSPKKEPSKDAPLRYGFLVFHILLLVIPGLAVIILVGYGCL